MAQTLAAIPLLLVVIVPILAWLIWDEMLSRRARRRRHAALTARPIMNREEWYDMHCREHNVSLEAAVAMAGALAEALDCDPTQLRMSDSMEGTLAVRPKRWLAIDEVDIEFEALDEEILKRVLPESAWIALGRDGHGMRSLADLTRWYDETVLGRRRTKP
jgi:hypothetical protein